MNMTYRLGWPFGKALARAGFPVVVQVDVIRDQAAGVFVGTSSDVQGLVVEAETFEELVRETDNTLRALFEVEHARLPALTRTKFSVDGNLACA